MRLVRGLPHKRGSPEDMIGAFHQRGVPILGAVTELVFLLFSIAGCAARREVSPEPIQLSRPLPVAVRKDAWPAIVKTLLQQGEVIRTTQRPLDRVTFGRALAKDNLQQFCDVQAIRTVDVDSWKFINGKIEIAIWLENEQSGGTEVQLKMEGRCQTTFSPPQWRMWLLAPIFVQLPAAILTAGKANEWAIKPESIVLASTGELERQLQAKILTNLEIGLPPWLIKQQ